MGQLPDGSTTQLQTCRRHAVPLNEYTMAVTKPLDPDLRTGPIRAGFHVPWGQAWARPAV